MRERERERERERDRDRERQRQRERERESERGLTPPLLICSLTFGRSPPSWRRRQLSTDRSDWTTGMGREELARVWNWQDGGTVSNQSESEGSGESMSHPFPSQWVSKRNEKVVKPFNRIFFFK